MWAHSPSSSRIAKGFTVVELLVVIVVIGILAAITLVSYNTVQAKAQSAKISHDLETLKKAVIAARSATGTTLINITGSSSTYGACSSKANGTDLAALPKTDACWVAYYNAIDKIGAATGVSLHNMVDPWGRPYFIDENEGEIAGDGSTSCVRDGIASYTQPFTQSGRTQYTFIPNTGDFSICTNNTN